MILPKLYNGKDRTFWFFNLEWMRRISSSTSRVSVPTEAMRNGDFSGLIDSQGRLSTIYDPLTTNAQTGARQPFSYGGKLNAIDPLRISPLAKYLFSITPLPNMNVSPVLDSNYFYISRSTAEENSTFTTRIDHRISDHDQIYFRMTYLDDPSTYNTAIPFLNKVAGWKYVLDGERSAAASWVHTFSPDFVQRVPGHRPLPDRGWLPGNRPDLGQELA